MKPTVNQIVARAAKIKKIEPADIIGPRRLGDLCMVRQACYLIAREQGYSFPRIGARIGGRDHSTVIHGARKAAYDEHNDPEFAELLAALRAEYKPIVPGAERPYNRYPKPVEVAPVEPTPKPQAQQRAAKEDIPEERNTEAYIKDMIKGSARLKWALAKFQRERLAA